MTPSEQLYLDERKKFDAWWDVENAAEDFTAGEKASAWYAWQARAQSTKFLPNTLADSTLTIAIDFDKTWTAEPALWCFFCSLAALRGHNVIIATGREKWSEDMDRHGLPPSIPVIYCGREFKEHACLKAGYKVHIWIDDMPGTIQQCVLLRGDLSSAPEAESPSAARLQLECITAALDAAGAPTHHPDIGAAHRKPMTLSERIAALAVSDRSTSPFPGQDLITVTEWDHPSTKARLILEGTGSANLAEAREYFTTDWCLLTGTEKQMPRAQFEALKPFEP